LKMIDGVKVGCTELGRIFMYCSIAVNNCVYNLFGSLNFRLDNTERNLALIV